jgi:hypothetical protein
MINYKPTWLYIKQHNVTGLKYFGKTVKADPFKYRGSGDHWKSHLKKHGNDVTTIWSQLFESKEELVEYALKFSEENNITESEEWANLKPENGLDGGCTGTIRSESTRKRLSEANLGKKQSEETKQKRAKSNIGKHSIPKSDECKQRIKDARKLQVMTPHSDETKAKMSKSHTGKRRSEEQLAKIRKSVIIFGKYYASAKCASEELGISIAVVYKNLISAKYPDWNYSRGI